MRNLIGGSIAIVGLSCCTFVSGRSPVVMSGRPDVAEMANTFTANCKGIQFEVESSQNSSRSIVKLNSNKVQGGAVIKKLLNDISGSGSIIRYQAFCNNSNGYMNIRITKAYIQKGTLLVNFWGGNATFSNSNLIHYSGMSKSNAETYWFR